MFLWNIFTQCARLWTSVSFSWLPGFVWMSHLSFVIFSEQVWVGCTTSWTTMSMSRSGQSNMSLPCTKPWMEWTISHTTRRQTYSSSSARINWAGETKRWEWNDSVVDMLHILFIWHEHTAIIFCLFFWQSASICVASRELWRTGSR